MWFNGALLQDVLEGTFSTDIARAVFYGLSVQAKLVELSAAADLEHRLADLEERLASSQPPKRVTDGAERRIRSPPQRGRGSPATAAAVHRPGGARTGAMAVHGAHGRYRLSGVRRRGRPRAHRTPPDRGCRDRGRVGSRRLRCAVATRVRAGRGAQQGGLYAELGAGWAIVVLRPPFRGHPPAARRRHAHPAHAAGVPGSLACSRTEDRTFSRGPACTPPSWRCSRPQTN